MANDLLALSDWSLSRLVYCKARQGVDCGAEALTVFGEATEELDSSEKELFSSYNHLQAVLNFK